MLCFAECIAKLSLSDSRKTTLFHARRFFLESYRDRSESIFHLNTVDRPRTYLYDMWLKLVQVNDDGDDDEQGKETGKVKEDEDEEEEETDDEREHEEKRKEDGHEKWGEGRGGNRCSCQSQDTIVDHGPTERGE